MSLIPHLRPYLLDMYRTSIKTFDLFNSQGVLVRLLLCGWRRCTSGVAPLFHGPLTCGNRHCRRARS